MILPPQRDPELTTIRSGGSLTDEHHRLLARWAADCARHVLPLFERVQPSDPRPGLAIDAIAMWCEGDLPMMESRAAGGHAMAAARGLKGAARFAAFAAGQAACVAHVPAHDLGAAAYAIRAVMAANPETSEQSRLNERAWQHDHLPDEVRAVVLRDQQRRNHLCWSVFSPADSSSER